ncbi:hypothetical protein CWR48_04150 [Oceanobacillus arenosus]|uniref:Uncharacterized protein n=1 Tax=Oceanobacillus arenosus TaxID=1229153 RepID=A0A3D8PYY9_9BACI|nr:hypothetical protein [Oceanobacillus arenosus]RDW21012.1 hypothetical protein CWR48_04150 [Oceanobacillus arenosus]
MTDLSMFLDADQEEAEKLLDACKYNLSNAKALIKQGEFLKASIYHRNVANYQEQLQQLKNSKNQVDLALEQIRGKYEQDELLRRLGAIQ